MYLDFKLHRLPAKCKDDRTCKPCEAQADCSSHATDSVSDWKLCDPDDKVWRYLVYLKYWTPNHSPL